MPGALMGWTPAARSYECKRIEEITRSPWTPASSSPMISLKARPIQETDKSVLRFSNRRTAIRLSAGATGFLEQETRTMEVRKNEVQTRRLLLQYTRLQSQ